MQQSFLNLPNIVNIASVPHRSPFRYPGGKTWLVPRIREWLMSLPQRPKEFIEPFAGGGIIALTVAFENLADHVTMIELDNQVAAVWKVILSDDALWLADQIESFNLSYEEVYHFLNQPAKELKTQALQTIIKNRVNRGGILANGAGMIKKGENGKGLSSRWYPQTLKKRIIDIYAIRNKITFIEADGLKILEKQLDRNDIAVFIDPPYTISSKKAGSRLYNHSTIDHEKLFKVASSMACQFLMTYDLAEEVLSLAKLNNLDTKCIAMKNTHHAKMNELLVSKALNWIQS
ncbi:DNA adenine methylase [Herpetosiphon llansteffanensis]|uniref:DNA adenine methylase n=1 Tax=Herpetosiphon llansteffanensis TaxID=2094568 RepID=UPI000D7B93A6|nr:DNA adenine methylase [Herpetosiphon llansteffanensis]